MSVRVNTPNKWDWSREEMTHCDDIDDFSEDLPTKPEVAERSRENEKFRNSWLWTRLERLLPVDGSEGQAWVRRGPKLYG